MDDDRRLSQRGCQTSVKYFQQFLGCPTFDPEIGTSCFSFYLISLFIKKLWWCFIFEVMRQCQVCSISVANSFPKWPANSWGPFIWVAKPFKQVIHVDRKQLGSLHLGLPRLWLFWSTVTSCICVQSILGLYFQYALSTFEQNKCFGRGIQRRWVAFPRPSFSGKVSTVHHSAVQED